ncbi:hypothetical protein IE53DRAFT_76505 [Violaceomyces palustris]|uniref:Uncharacterized protein n=1 Tax=Violaceomyces palustris TaxID=1673888 RepID=A0ACD0P756_9BASI|nr:hypothetical protein IE53DRAFT_76505 [Violaceomyces palustris]
MGRAPTQVKLVVGLESWIAFLPAQGPFLTTSASSWPILTKGLRVELSFLFFSFLSSIRISKHAVESSCGILFVSRAFGNVTMWITIDKGSRSDPIRIECEFRLGFPFAPTLFSKERITRLEASQSREKKPPIQPSRFQDRSAEG